MNATLYIFSGQPGSGKSTLAAGLAAHLGAVYLRIDTIEQGLRDLCAIEVEGEGYRLAYRLAHDNLKLGIAVVADSCNPILLTRGEWNAVALDLGLSYRNIEIRCSNESEHRQRIESRLVDVPGLVLPTWSQIVAREYDAWTSPVISVDTAGELPDVSLQRLVRLLEAQA